MFRFAKAFAVAALGISLFAAAPAVAEGLDEIPEATRKQVYDPNMLDPAQPIGPSAYRDLKAKPPPWTIGYASSYAGNTWRAGVMDRLAERDHSRSGRSSASLKDVIITQSNLQRLGPDPADAPARRPGRRRDHRLLLEPDGAQPDGEVCL